MCLCFFHHRGLKPHRFPFFPMQFPETKRHTLIRTTDAMCEPLAGVIAAAVPVGMVALEALQVVPRIPGPGYLEDILPLGPPPPIYVSPVQYQIVTVEVTRFVMHTVTDVTTIYELPTASFTEILAPSEYSPDATSTPFVVFTPSRTRQRVPDIDSDFVDTRYDQLKQKIAKISIELWQFIIVAMMLAAPFSMPLYRFLRQVSFVNLVASTYATADGFGRDHINLRWVASLFVRWNLRWSLRRKIATASDVGNQDTQGTPSDIHSGSSRDEAANATSTIGVDSQTIALGVDADTQTMPTGVDAETQTVPTGVDAETQTVSLPEDLDKCLDAIKQLNDKNKALGDQLQTLQRSNAESLSAAHRRIEELELERAKFGFDPEQMQLTALFWEEQASKTSELYEQLKLSHKAQDEELQSLTAVASELQIDNLRLQEDSDPANQKKKIASSEKKAQRAKLRLQKETEHHEAELRDMKTVSETKERDIGRLMRMLKEREKSEEDPSNVMQEKEAEIAKLRQKIKHYEELEDYFEENMKRKQEQFKTFEEAVRVLNEKLEGRTEGSD